MSERVCTVCRYVGKPKRMTKGSFGLEAALWLLFIVPGLIYSIWRLTSRYDGCPKCKNQSMIPTDTPMGQELIKESKQYTQDKAA